ncbi:chemotaxis protein CheD [Eubacterium sp. MSJ-13]|uniref:chemotaxis protein CheD n=1 Tax=Eubacterium sp. MSJ-13 TaxID=2841513 RepID=UPI001C11E6EE|nr:chemotaxis protein CheD [Eubacterium sp. MSJ-13]MBU5478081.1 chemotaxis protein CheD [Eubacterium sp. MSJ-13]
MAQIVVGIAEMRMGTKRDELITYALGSCVGICMYDNSLKIGGLLHAMLPDAYENEEHVDMNLERYVNTGIQNLFRMVCTHGADVRNLKVKLVGGANMFGFDFTNKDMDIGTQNVIQSKRILAGMGIPVVAQMTGGTVGRTIRFSPESAQVQISATDGSKFIL